LDVIQERLEREFGLELIATAPSVAYEVALRGKPERVVVTNPADWPDPAQIDSTFEPVVTAEILVPTERMGAVIKLAEARRGKQITIKYPSLDRAQVVYEIPLAEVVIDFYDQLKSISAGYASFSYEITGMREEELVQVTISVATEDVPALAFIAPRVQAEGRGRVVCKKLKDILPKEMFAVAIQAMIGGKIIARETISAMRKDVTGYLYGGDRTRKDKLLKKQSAGKKRMKKFGRVQIPQDAFLALLKRD
jgi:GTP-binding protein LepA